MAARFRLRHLWLLVPFWGIAVRAGRPLGDNSFLWHVRAGADQVAAGEVIRTDPYSFSRAGEPWRTQSWLIELGYGRLETWFPGLDWVGWFLFAVVGATLAVVLGILWSRHGLHVGMIVVFVTLAWLLQPYVQPRPVVMTFLFFALIAAIIGAERPPLWAVPPLVWLWAAVHGSFVVGLAFLGLDAVRRRSRRQAVAVVMGAIAASLTAHGAAVWRILIDFLANREGLELIQEWRPPDFTTPWLAAFLVVMGVLMVGLAAGRIPPGALWVVLPAVVFGLTSARAVLPAALLLSPWLADAATALPDRAETAANRGVVWATAAALIASAVFALARPVRLNEGSFPEPDAVARAGDGRLFTTVAAAGYLIYADEARRVLVDDRVELYGVELLERYQAAVAGVEWRDLFAEYAIAQALLPSHVPLLGVLEEAGWVHCHDDGDFVLIAERCG